MKKVQFEETAATTTRNEATKKNSIDPSPTRVFMGKAHPIRDLIAFLSVFGLALFATSGMSFGGGKDTKKKPTNVKKQNILETTIQTIMETRYREKTCDIFLHSGRIPRGGLSLFAGKEYGMNVVLLDALNDPFVGILIKPHPTLANVKFVRHDDDKELYSVETIQPVAKGEELFISFDDIMVIEHPEYYTTIPTESDYQAAHDIAQNLPYSNPASNKWKRTRHRQPGYAIVQKHVRDAVTRVHPNVGHLLSYAPGDPSRNISEMFLRRQSVTRAGTCVERTHVNAYQTGELVARIPLELSKRECSVVYGDRYCGIVSSIAVAEDAAAGNVKLVWKTDSDNYRPVLEAMAVRPIAPNTEVCICRNVRCEDYLTDDS